jgi:hypothetical protein
VKSKKSSRLSDVKYVLKHPLVSGGIIALILTITIFLLFKHISSKVMSLVSSLLAESSLIITGLYNAVSTTTTLNHELDIECRSDDCSKGRVIIRVKNTGRNIAKGVYALVSIRARKIGSPKEERYLGKFLVDKDLCGNLITTNEDPHIEGEYLPWLPPHEGVTKVSIDPGHSRELLVFEYERVPDGYVIRVPSEGGVGKPRVCLWLDFNTKYVFHVTVYGKSVRLPLETELYITMDKLDAIVSSKAMLRRIYFDEEEIAREVVNIVLKELGNDGGITERAAISRRGIFDLASEDNIEGYLGIASGFETLWNELRSRFREEPRRAVYLGSIFGVLYEYAVYLALARRWDELTSFIRNNRLLFSCIDDVCVMMKFLLNLIITDEEFREKFGDWLISDNIYDTLKYYVPRHLRPALARLLLPFGYENITCEFVCGHDEEERLDRECYESCERMLNAFNGDEHAVYEITSELDSVLQRHWKYEDWVKKSSKGLAPPALIKEIIDYVRSNEKPQDWGFFSRAVVELRLPTTSRLRFILILHDLLRAREEFEKGNIDEAIKFVDLAETHAIIGIMRFESKRSKELIEETDIEPSLSFHLLFLYPSVDISFNLARTLTSAIKGSLEKNKKFEISSDHALILLSLYHYHVQTNLAETWP